MGARMSGTRNFRLSGTTQQAQEIWRSIWMEIFATLKCIMAKMQKNAKAPSRTRCNSSAATPCYTYPSHLTHQTHQLNSSALCVQMPRGRFVLCVGKAGGCHPRPRRVALLMATHV